MRWLAVIIDSKQTHCSMSLSNLEEIVKDKEAWHVVSMGVPRVIHD